MSNFKQNNIDFTIENNFQTGEKNHPVNGKLTSAFNDYAGYEQDDASKLINAVEIDWNNATTEMGGQTKVINTTGELISYLATAYTNALSGGVDENSVNNLIGSYITNKIPITWSHTIQDPSYPQSHNIKIGGSIPYSMYGSTFYSNTTSTIRLINFDSDYGNPNSQRTARISFNVAYTTGKNGVKQCAYFDTLGYFHAYDVYLKNEDFTTETSISYLINNLPIHASHDDLYNLNQVFIKHKDSQYPNISTQPMIQYGIAQNSAIQFSLDSTHNIYFKKDGSIIANDYYCTDYDGNKKLSTILSNITPADHQSGNSGPVIACDTTTGNLFKSLATVDDTGVFFTSDISLKENVEQIIDSEIDKLFETESGNMYSFDWKDSHEHSFGFIAQELEQFAPEAVHEFDGIKKVNYEVALTKVCAAMFKKIKQLEARIDELEK